jgi:hypothetical protein
MVIRTEYRGTRYSVGTSDPLPAGFEIRFGSLNFQAMGNGYLMRLTNREELRARRQVGSAPVAAARVATTQTPAGTDAAGPSASRRRRHSGQCSRQAQTERRQVECAASQRGGGARGLRATLPHRSARRYDGLQRQRQHHDAQGSPWPSRLRR